MLKQMVWEEFTIDNFFPHMPFDKTAFIENYYPMVWPLVLEKAYAKFKGTFESLATVPVQHMLYDLLGYPVEMIEFKAKCIRYV